jgi:hypothetical protein
LVFKHASNGRVWKEKFRLWTRNRIDRIYVYTMDMDSSYWKVRRGERENWGLWTGNREKIGRELHQVHGYRLRKNEMEKISAKVLLIQSIDHNLRCVLHFAQHNAIISSESKSHQTWSQLVNPPDCSLFVFFNFHKSLPY